MTRRREERDLPSGEKALIGIYAVVGYILISVLVVATYVYFDMIKGRIYSIFEGFPHNVGIAKPSPPARL